ncbi:MAG: Fic family protein [Defluviitaleaceae bacterium]|nr:Fic family protein [Defluviitaleaceae bacterium]MCL2274940.1 Fic family protein [Defluviitaleaceae bacterium]
MWNDIQLNSKQVSKSLRRRCAYLIGLIENYDGAVFQEMEDARHVHGSLKVENNKLSFVQTTMVLRGEIPRSADIKNQDILETLSLSNALNEARALVGRVPFSEEVVKRVHKTCANGQLNPLYCGEYRTVMNYIGDGSYTTAAPNQINKLMQRLFTALEGEPCPIVKAAFFSFNYLSIHPFMDFNGRTSRLFECYLLGEGGLPFISLKENQIEEYMNLLGEGQKNGKPYFEPYVNFILTRVEERFDEIMAGVALAVRQK